MHFSAKNLAMDTDGSTMPIFAISIMGIIALVGATIALGMDSRAAGNLQATADTAALSGATAFINVSSPKSQDRLDEAQRLAKSIAESNADYVLTDLDVEAVADDAYGQHTTIDVEMTFEPVNIMAKVAGRNANVTITRRATADATWGFPLCILGLQTSGSALMTADDVKVTAENCVIWSNSSASNSMDFNGGDVTTKHLCTVGKASIGLGSKLSPSPTEQCEPIPDPLHDWRAPSFGVIKNPGDIAIDDYAWLFDEIQWILDMNGFSLDLGSEEATQGDPGFMMQFESAIDTIGGLANPKGISKNGIPATKGVHLSLDEALQLIGLLDNLDPETYKDDKFYDSPTLTLSPGTYKGLNIGYGHVKMLPGVYHIVDAPLLVRRRATLTGEGVTLIFHGDHATLSVTDEARLTLTAPVDGPTAGFALAENRRASLKSSDPYRSRLTGSGAVNAIGTIYLPRQKLSITGKGAADQTSPLLQIVAHTVDMADEGALKIKFDTSKTDVPAAIKPERTARLVN